MRNFHSDDAVSVHDKLEFKDEGNKVSTKN